MLRNRIAVWRLFLIINSVAFSALAQIPLTDPPDSVPTRGSSATGQYALSQIESVNAATGNVTLSIPLAHLPPGPGGFTAGVNLVYNSSLYDIENTIPDAPYYYPYVTSTHGGGWNYGYKFTLWTQRRVSQDFNLSTECQGIGTTGQRAWFKNYLQTPDGSNHVLSLVATVQNGTVTSPPSTSIARDPNDAYWQYDIAGNTSQSCGLTNAPFSGTLVFASSDSSYIRVEMTVSSGSGSWVAYFADGSQVNGASITSVLGHATDSDSTQLTDRNGNSLSFGGSCAIGSACTETLTDLQGRSLTIQYASNAGGTWTDALTWPGIHGNLTTNVDWASLTPDQSISYYPSVNSDGTTYSSFTENLAANLSPLPSVVNSIELPPGTSGGPFSRFTFGYGSWGEVHSLTLSTGTAGSWTQQYNAAYTYCYDVGISSCTFATYPRPPATMLNPIKNKVLTYSEVRNGASIQTIPETTSYAIDVPPNAFTYPQTGQVSNVTYPDGSFSEVFTANLCPSNFKSRDFCPALPYEIINRDGSVTLMGWTSQTPPGSVSSSAIFNPYVQYTTVTAPGFSFIVSKGASRVQDPNGNPTSLSEYDWISTSSVQQGGGTFITSITGTPSRTTTTAYYQPSTNPAYWQQHGAPTYLRAKQSVMVNGTTCAAAAACATYSYDQALSTANLTQVQQYDSVTGTNISSTATYLVNGNLQSQTDPNQVRTLICYDGANLYPITRIVGATASANCSTLQKLPEARTANFAIDFNSGLSSSTTDADNGITTTYSYDNIGRQTAAVQQPASGSARSTTTTYNDVNPGVVTTSDNSPGPQLVSAIDYDGLGRVIETHSGVGTASSWVDTAYAFDSSAHRTYELESNPYYLLNSESPTGWTRTTRDPAGRVVAVDHYSGATRPPPLGSNSNVTGTVTLAYDTTTSGCTGPSVHVTDEAGNMHQNCYDGLGRMTSVTEPNGTVTNYAYNALDNLATVDVAGQTSTTCTLNSAVHMRCFEYSTLSRLIKATNAESNAVSYVYDSVGNIKTRTDAIGNITTFNSYDALNRPQSVTYMVTGTTVSTPSVFYTYDTDFKGGLSSVCASMNTSSCTSPISTTSYTHDAFGRIATSTQTTGVSYLFSYGYSQADQLTHITYPSGRQVNYSLDGLGRVQTVQNGGTGSYYVSGITYTAADGMSSMTMGNGVTQQVTWNDRLQPTNLQASSGANSLLALGFSPCSAGGTSCSTGNNGSLRQQTINAPSLSLTQAYGYDNLNRLTSAVETGGTGWTQNYGYDGNGNRALTFSSSNLPYVTDETPTGTNSYTASNRIIGYTYDAAGNVLQVSDTVRSFRYDAENRQVKACNGCSDVNSSPTATYTYDGDGQRVSKTVNGQTTTYVYDAFGNLAVEYGQAEASPCGTPTCYLTVDHLGSTRMLTNSSGAAARRYDYLPFGQELLAGMGARTTGIGYVSAPDDSNPKFTGEVRDAETALDWLAIRAVSGAQGRFQSVDPANAGAYIADPQTWNGYSYVGNNPLSYTDPSGEGIFSWLGSIIGGFLGGPLGAFIGYEAGSAGEAVLWGPSSNIGSSLPSIGSIAGCGGPLGNCGSFGAGPWSENSGLGDVQDPGRFVNDLEARKVVADTADLIAGAGDTISFGFSAWFRRTMAGKDPRNGCSAYYKAGSWIGVGVSAAYGGAAGFEKAGVAGAGKEFSHWIPARLGGPRTPLNGNYVSVAEHALSDPSRYRFMPRVWKEANPLPGAVTQQLNRIPNALTGTAIGGAWGAVGQFLAGAHCGN